MSVDFDLRLPEWERPSWVPPASPRRPPRTGTLVVPVFAGRKVTRPEGGLMLPEELEIDAMPFTSDPFMDWIEAHRAEMARYIGRFVVIDPARGIVDDGDDPVALSRRNTPLERVMVTFVSPELDAAL